MADSLFRGVRNGHVIGPVIERQSHGKTTGILDKMADCAVPFPVVFADALRPKSNGKMGRNKLSSVRGAEYRHRARRGGSFSRELGLIGNSLRSLYRSLVRESRMDKLVADVETMFSAIADRSTRGKYPESES